eukprot:1139786-Pelagomonas_calceolata.AAC.3
MSSLNKGARHHLGVSLPALCCCLTITWHTASKVRAGAAPKPSRCPGTVLLPAYILTCVCACVCVYVCVCNFNAQHLQQLCMGASSELVAPCLKRSGCKCLHKRLCLMPPCQAPECLTQSLFHPITDSPSPSNPWQLY